MPSLSSAFSGASAHGDGGGRTSSSSHTSASSPGGSSPYGGGLAALDFTRVAFQSLRSLSLEGVPLAGLRLTADNCPALESLSVSNAAGSLAFFELALPELKRLSLEGVVLAPPGPQGRGGDDFAVSLGQCPNLASFAGYRLLGIGGMHYVSLPQCSSFSLLFCDDVKALDVYGPRLATLDCQACPSLIRLHMHDGPLAGPAAVRAFRLEANRMDEARSGACLLEDEAERDTEMDALVARFSQAVGLDVLSSSGHSQSSASPAAAATAGWRAEQKEEAAASGAQGEAWVVMAAAAGDGDEEGSLSGGSDCCDGDGGDAEATRLPPVAQQPLLVNLLNTNLGASSLQHLAMHPRVGPDNLEGVTQHAAVGSAAVGVSRLLPVESSGDLHTDATTSCCSVGSGGVPGLHHLSSGGSSSLTLTPRSLASPCSSLSSGGFALAAAAVHNKSAKTFFSTSS